MIYLALIILNIISLMLRKLQRISSFALTIYLGYLVGSPNILTNADYFVYYDSYVYHDQIFEQGYMFLAGVYQNLGIGYPAFRLQLSLIAAVILWFGIIRITRYPTLGILLFAIGNFFVDVIQMRNFLMLAVAIFGISFIARTNNYKRNIFGLIIVYCSLLFHSAGIFFFLSACLSILPYNFLKKISLIFSSISIISSMALITSTGREFINRILVFVLSLFSQRSNVVNNLLTVYQNPASNTYWIESAVIIFFAFLIVLLIQNSLPEQREEIFSVTLCFIPVILLSLALLKISEDYSRAIRNLGFVFALMLMDPISHAKYIANKVYSLVCVSIISLSLAWLSIYSGYYQNVVPNIPSAIRLRD